MVIGPFELVRAEEILLGYSCRWFDEPYRVIAVEAEFDAPLVNPDTGEESTAFRLGGKIDCLLEDLRTHDVVLLESKSTSEDATPGSPYWLRTLMSSQLSTYMVGVKSLGHDPKRIVYDVIHRPALRPLKATPIESRKYKANGTLYANQRERDEIPEEFRFRVRASIVENPAKYYNRGSPVMLAKDVSEAAYDAWQISELIEEGRRLQRYPRNPDACSGFGNSPCTFLPVCSGSADVTDPYRYRKVKDVHEELTPRKTLHGLPLLPLLTNSQMASFRKCQRLHKHRYFDGVRALQSTEAQRSGTLVHNGLEGWWTGKKLGHSEQACLAKAYEFMRRERVVPAYLPEEAVA